jgi:hypothetical protein
MEFEKKCGEDWYAKQSEETRRLVTVHYGDQQSVEDLTRVIAETKVQYFDFIVEDGGHSMKMQQVSTSYLFQFVRPGGAFFLEDLLTSFIEGYFTALPTTVDEIISETLFMAGKKGTATFFNSNQFGMMKNIPDVEHIDLYYEMAVFVKYKPRQLSLPFSFVHVPSSTADISLGARFESVAISGDQYKTRPILERCHKSKTKKCTELPYQFAFERYVPELSAKRSPSVLLLGISCVVLRLLCYCYRHALYYMSVCMYVCVCTQVLGVAPMCLSGCLYFLVPNCTSLETPTIGVPPS